ARRYQSAAGMADDIRRYLNDEPISARRASTIYQARKFARRHRGLVGGAVAVLVVMVVGTVVSLSMAIQATRARAAETAQRERAENNLQAATDAVDKYLTNVSESAELKARGLEPLRRQLLGTAKEFYEGFAKQRTDDPKLQRRLASAYQRLGDINRELGANDEAERAYRQAMAIFDQPGHEKDGPTDRSGIYNNLALLYRDTGRNAEAEALFKKALPASSDPPSGDHLDEVYWRSIADRHDNLGTMYMQTRRPDKSEEHHKKGLAIRRRLLELFPESELCRNEVSISDVNLGTLYATTNRPAEAEPFLREAIALGQALVDKYPQSVLYQNALAASLNNLGGVYTLLGDNVAAEEIHLKSLAIREKMAAEHPAVPEYALRLASSYTNLGELDTRESRAETALDWLDKSIPILEGVLQKEPRDTTARYYLSYTLSWRAKALESLTRFDEAIAAWDKAIKFDDRNDESLRTGRAETLSKSRSP
ncbi:MAG: tetratricopeptide repeat protein, partial [Phycisphaerales bacterium]|nr:tetratricopeptide repeat protein [Phycisphaerales bacterium]